MAGIIVHIGTHKTGTTSIQRTMNDHRAKLRARGINYPDYSEIGLPGHYAHLDMAVALAGQHQKYSPETAMQFFSHIRHSAPAFTETILSAEPLYRLTLSAGGSRLGRTPKGYWKRRERFVARFRDVIGPARIVIVLRRQDDFAESMYQEQVKVTRYHDDFASYLRKFWFHYAYCDQIALWEAYFGPVTIIPFHSIAGRDIASAFLKRLGLAPGRMRPTGNQNIGISADGVILKRALNAALRDRTALRRVGNVMSEPAMAALLHRGKRSLFASRAERLTFLEQFKDENAALAARMGISVSQLFPTRLSGGVNYGDSMPNDRYVHLLQALSQTMNNPDWMAPLLAKADI
jgi:hypothetical protein